MFLILDIDGTLTNSKKEISPKTLEALINIQERGHRIILATGRPTYGVKWICDALKLNEFGGYVLSFNGARTINTKTMDVVFQQEFPHQLIAELHAYAADKQIGIISYEDGDVLVGTDMDKYIGKEMMLNRMRGRMVPNFVEYVDFPVNKCLMTCDPEKAVEVVSELSAKYDGLISVYRSEPFFVELMPLGVDKAASLHRLFKMEGIRREDTVACGDGFNDISMIKFAGVGVAMKNAQPQVKCASDFVTHFTNDEDGLIEVIDKWFK